MRLLEHVSCRVVSCHQKSKSTVTRWKLSCMSPRTANNYILICRPNDIDLSVFAGNQRSPRERWSFISLDSREATRQMNIKACRWNWQQWERRRKREIQKQNCLVERKFCLDSKWRKGWVHMIERRRFISAQITPQRQYKLIRCFLSFFSRLEAKTIIFLMYQERERDEGKTSPKRAEEKSNRTELPESSFLVLLLFSFVFYFTSEFVRTIVSRCPVILSRRRASNDHH